MSGVASQHSDGYVLHRYPYRETSLILETFTRSHGRLSMVAKGAKRASAASKHALHPFQPLSLTWFGRAEMKTLKSAEHERILPQLRGAALLSAFYVNELLLKLAHRDDPHEGMFVAYETVVGDLAVVTAEGRDGMRAIEVSLRRFEVSLLAELGYALRLDSEADTHQPLLPDRNYVYLFERGPIDVARCDRSGEAVRGKTLLDLAAGTCADPQGLAEAKALMRRAINHLLGDKVLHTRQLIRDLNPSSVWQNLAST